MENISRSSPEINLSPEVISAQERDHNSAASTSQAPLPAQPSPRPDQEASSSTDVQDHSAQPCQARAIQGSPHKAQSSAWPVNQPIPTAKGVWYGAFHSPALCLAQPKEGFSQESEPTTRPASRKTGAQRLILATAQQTAHSPQPGPTTSSQDPKQLKSSPRSLAV